MSFHSTALLLMRFISKTIAKLAFAGIGISEVFLFPQWAKSSVMSNKLQIRVGKLHMKGLYGGL